MIVPQRAELRGQRPLAAASMAALVALLWLRAGWAAGAASLVEWDAPEGCLGALDVYRRVGQVLGYEPDTFGKLSRVRGSVLRVGNGYRLVLEAFEPERRSSRLFEAASCDDLVDAAAIAIALAIAPERARAIAEATAPPAGSASATEDAADGASDDVDVAPAVVRTPSEAPGLRGFASAGGVIEYGALPRPTPGFAVAAGVDLGVASLAAYGTLLGSQALSVAPEQSVEFELLFAGLRGCFALRDSAPRLNACAGFEAGRFRALGLELAQARQTRDLWLAAGVALDAVWPLSSALGVEVRAEPMLPLSRKQYTINGTEDVHAPDVLSSRLYVGLTFSGG